MARLLTQPVLGELLVTQERNVAYHSLNKPQTARCTKRVIRTEEREQDFARLRCTADLDAVTTRRPKKRALEGLSCLHCSGAMQASKAAL